jgi:hypothetical protein
MTDQDEFRLKMIPVEIDKNRNIISKLDDKLEVLNGRREDLAQECLDLSKEELDILRKYAP